MKALIKNDSEIKVCSVPKPWVRSNSDVVIEVAVAGLCRTDIYVAEGRMSSKKSLILGHEFSGKIVELGDSVENLALGQRVTAMPIFPCHLCAQCKNGAKQYCQKKGMLGVDYDGAFAEFVVVPAWSVFQLPDSVAFQVGAYSEPVAAALSVLKADICPQQYGLIYGENRIARLIHQVLTLHGFKNIKLYNPSEAPTDTEENVYDFAVETIASSKALEDMVRLVRPRGKIILKSRQCCPVGIDFIPLIHKELTLQAVNYGSFEQAIELLADKKIVIDELIGPIHQLENFAEVFQQAKSDESTKHFFRLH